MLAHAIDACQPFERLLQIVHERLVVEGAVVFAIEVLEIFQLFDIGQAHEGSQIEVEGRYGLSAVHLVLGALQRDTGQHAGRLDALGRARCAMTGNEAAVQNVVQRVLHAGERLGGVVVLIVNVQVVVLHGVAALGRQQVVVDKRLGGLRGELHHHAGRRVGIHIGILAGDVVRLHVHDVQKHVARLGLTGYGALVAVGDVFLCDVLAGALHQLHLDHVLNLLHGHLRVAVLGHVVGDAP